MGQLNHLLHHCHGIPRTVREKRGRPPCDHLRWQLN
jgi:hypothetical protein